VTTSAIQRFLARHRKIGMDTSIFIYQVEGHPKYLELTRATFAWLESPSGRAVTSTITMLELLVQPYRLSDFHRVNELYLLLSRYPNLDWVEPGLGIADRAARLRAEHRLGVADAVQAATALASEATGFVSNDKTFKRMTRLDVLVLDDALICNQE